MISMKDNIGNEAIKLFGVSIPGSKLIMYNEEVAGMIDYNVTDEIIKINYITVHKNFRRNGIARQIIQMIMNDNKGKDLCGDALPSAYHFWEKLGAIFLPDNDEYLSPFYIKRY